MRRAAVSIPANIAGGFRRRSKPDKARFMNIAEVVAHVTGAWFGAEKAQRSAGKANGFTLPSAINLGQIRSVDRERLVKRLGALDAGAMRKVAEALKISLGLSDL
jgi:mRNA-degrading endonuclease toxin of MazEF toxin-antitoxin module